jgi:hypothetical protein
VQGSLSGKKILLISDSHAAQLNMAMDVVRHRLNYVVTVLTASSCVTMPSFNFSNILISSQEACKLQIQKISSRLNELPIILLSGKWAYQLSAGNFQDQLKEFLELTQRQGIQAILFADIPKLFMHPARQDRLAKLNILMNIKLLKGGDDTNQAIQALVSQYSHAKWVDVSHSPLFETAPFYQGSLIYSDEYHLNEYGSKLYGDLLVSSNIEQIISGKRK